MFSVRKSPIHGLGAYADRSLPRGTVLGHYTGRRFAEHRLPPYKAGSPTYYWLLTTGQYIDGDSDLRFINHSCDPNVEAEEVTVGRRLQVAFKTRRIVRPGTELLLDYRLQAGPDDRDPYTCLCGSPKCRGTMKDTK